MDCLNADNLDVTIQGERKSGFSVNPALNVPIKKKPPILGHPALGTGGSAGTTTMTTSLPTSLGGSGDRPHVIGGAGSNRPIIITGMPITPVLNELPNLMPTRSDVAPASSSGGGGSAGGGSDSGDSTDDKSAQTPSTDLVGANSPFYKSHWFIGAAVGLGAGLLFAKFQKKSFLKFGAIGLAAGGVLGFGSSKFMGSKTSTPTPSKTTPPSGDVQEK